MIQTLQKKKYTCTSCGHIAMKETTYCQFCKSYNTIISEEVKPKQKRISPISKKKQQELLESKGVVSELDLFFDKVRELELGGGCLCENCNISVRNALNSKDIWVWRGCIAHVVLKSKFRSVACNINNYLLLCHICHGQYDSSWANAIKMDVFPIAKERFDKFRHLITESISKLPPELTAFKINHNIKDMTLAEVQKSTPFFKDVYQAISDELKKPTERKIQKMN